MVVISDTLVVGADVNISGHWSKAQHTLRFVYFSTLYFRTGRFNYEGYHLGSRSTRLCDLFARSCMFLHMTSMCLGYYVVRTIVLFKVEGHVSSLDI